MSEAKLPLSLKKTIKTALKKQAKEFFGSRSVFNREDKIFIFQDDNFKNDIQEVRKELKIPHLDPDKDLVFIPVGEDEGIEDSDWVNKLNQEHFDKFDTRVKWILHKYKLPLNFRETIEFYLLYCKNLKNIPLYNLGLIKQAMFNPDELKRIPLTTQEKKFIKLYILVQYGERIKRDKNLKKDYTKLLQVLAASKNKRRKMRTFNTALWAYKKPKRHGERYDPVKEKWMKPRYTFGDLATEEYEEVNTKKEVLQKATILRKQKQRLKDRYKTPSQKPQN